MALLDRIAAQATARREVARADPVTLEEFGYLLARGTGEGVRTKAGASIGTKRVLGITAWYSGVRYIAETVATLPWHHYLRQPDESRERRAPQPWLARPDVDQTWLGLVEHLVMAMANKGDGYAWKVRNAAGQVVGLREIHPDRVTGGIAPDGSKRFMIDRDEHIYTTREVLHVPGLAFDGRFGINPIRNFAETLGLIAAADDYAARFFGNGSHMGGLISVPQMLQPGEREALRQEWDQFHAGLLNAHRTGVLSKGATYTRISLDAQSAQLLETRTFGVTDVSRMLRIPPHKLYELSRATFSNIEHQGIEATTDSIRPWVVRIENAINSDPDLVLAGHYIEASLEGLLRGDSASRAAYYTAGINGGWLTPARAARLENQPAPAELDYYLRPLNMAVIRPGEPEPEQNTDDARELSLAEQLQKIYLAVDKVITAEEARQIVGIGGTFTPPERPNGGAA